MRSFPFLFFSLQTHENSHLLILVIRSLNCHFLLAPTSLVGLALAGRFGILFLLRHCPMDTAPSVAAFSIAALLHGSFSQRPPNALLLMPPKKAPLPVAPLLKQLQQALVLGASHQPLSRHLLPCLFLPSAPLPCDPYVIH